MKVSHIFLTGLVAALGSIGAYAQQAAPASDAPSKTVKCTKGKVAAHNHGAEKGTGQAAMKPCVAASAAAEPADAASAAAKTRMGHDHGKVHKTM